MLLDLAVAEHICGATIATVSRRMQEELEGREEIRVHMDAEAE